MNFLGLYGSTLGATSQQQSWIAATELFEMNHCYPSHLPTMQDEAFLLRCRGWCAVAIQMPQTSLRFRVCGMEASRVSGIRFKPHGAERHTQLHTEYQETCLIIWAIREIHTPITQRAQIETHECQHHSQKVYRVCTSKPETHS